MAHGRMDIYSPRGTTVIFNHPDAGYKHDQVQAARWLQVGGHYMVERTEVHGFHTNVWLQEFPDQSFNSVHFDAFPIEEKPE